MIAVSCTVSTFHAAAGRGAEGAGARAPAAPAVPAVAEEDEEGDGDGGDGLEELEMLGAEVRFLLCLGFQFACNGTKHV